MTFVSLREPLQKFCLSSNRTIAANKILFQYFLHALHSSYFLQIKRRARKLPNPISPYFTYLGPASVHHKLYSFDIVTPLRLTTASLPHAGIPIAVHCCERYAWTVWGKGEKISA